MKTTKRKFLKKLGLGLLGGGSAILFGKNASSSAQKNRQKNIQTKKNINSRSNSLRLIYFTDCHARLEWQTPQALSRVANSINALKPDLVISGGDMITDGFDNPRSATLSRWDAYMKNLHSQIDADVFAAIGNHDLVGVNPGKGEKKEKNPRREFLQRMRLDKCFYHFDALGKRFIILDSIKITNDKYKFHGKIDAHQIDWLRSLLSNTPKSKAIVLVSHVPLASASLQILGGSMNPPPPSRLIVNNAEVFRIFSKHNLMLALHGHHHVFEEMSWKNTKILTGGAVCARWWRGQWHGTEEGFCVIDFIDDKIKNISYFDYGWKAKRPLNS